MKLLKTPLAAAAALALAAPSAMADGPFLNEIYASMAGTDNVEFIELYADVGTSLAGIVVLVVEGEGANAGTLDRVWDLTASGAMTSNYFTLGNTATSPDFDIGASNSIENGTETIYVVRTNDVAALLALQGTNIDPDGDLVTAIPGIATIIDIIGMAEGGVAAGTDFIYDGAGKVGPDGTFFPAGIFRDLDFPNSWCSESFLDFDPIANASEPSTQGAMNSPCPTPETLTYCTAGVSASGCEAMAWTAGVSSATAATGFNLMAGCIEGSKDGLFFFSTNGQQANSWGSGSSFQCVVPPVMRGGLLTGSGTTGVCDGLFSFDLSARWTAKPAQNPGVGAVVQAQLWYRDPFNTSNQTTSLSNAVEFTVAP